MNESQKNRIKLIGDETLETLKELKSLLEYKWITMGVAGETEFEYLKNSFLRDGKIEGINIYIKEIERIMYDQ